LSSFGRELAKGLAMAALSCLSEDALCPSATEKRLSLNFGGENSPMVVGRSARIVRTEGVDIYRGWV
jgi:hypothetical protein